MSSMDEFDDLVLEEALLEEGPPSRKRKLTSSVEPTQLPQRLDLGVSDASQGLAMVAIVDIAALDPHWGTQLEANRPLIHQHVEKLIHDFEQSLRRFDPENRVRASAHQAIIDRIKASVPESQRQKLLNYSARKPDEYCIVDLSNIDTSMNVNDMVMPSKLRLEAGKHRRAAIMKMNGISPKKNRGVFVDTDLTSVDTKV